MDRQPSQDARLNHLVAAHRNAITAYCHRRVHRDDVNDAVADVFLVAWRKIDQAPSDDEALLWLYGVARNVVHNHNRSARRRRRLAAKMASLAPSSAPNPEVQVVRRDEDQRLLTAVDRLKPSERELLRLRTWEELSLAEIAEVVGLSTRAVQSRLARTRKRLAALLEQEERRHTAQTPRLVEKGGSL